MKTLDGKVAIVTGGARDIGRAISEKLAANGAKVVVNYCNNADAGAATVKAIDSRGGYGGCGGWRYDQTSRCRESH